MRGDAKPLRRRFARVYFDDLEEQHPTTFYDPTALSTWLRLLILSEKAWPALPQLPRSVRRADLAVLRSDALLIEVEHGAFELKGWRAERARRAEVGRTAVEARSDRIERPTSMPTNVATNVSIIDVPAHAGGSLPAASGSRTELEAPVLVWLASVGAYLAPDGGKLHRNLVMFVERQGAEVVLAAMQVRYQGGDRTPSQLIFGAENELEQIHRPDRKPKPKGYQPDMVAGVAAFNRPLHFIKSED